MAKKMTIVLTTIVTIVKMSFDVIHGTQASIMVMSRMSRGWSHWSCIAVMMRPHGTHYYRTTRIHPHRGHSHCRKRWNGQIWTNRVKILQRLVTGGAAHGSIHIPIVWTLAFHHLISVKKIYYNFRKFFSFLFFYIWKYLSVLATRKT